MSDKGKSPALTAAQKKLIKHLSSGQSVNYLIGGGVAAYGWPENPSPNGPVAG